MRRAEGKSTRPVSAACMLAVALVTIGCGNDLSSSGPIATPTSGVTPLPTPLPSPTVVAITIVPSLTSPAGFDVAASDSGFLVAYGAAATGGSSSIYGVLLGADGQLLGATPFLVSVARSDGYLGDPSWTNPAVGFDGTSYAVAYAGTGTAGGVPAVAITAVLVSLRKNVGSPTDLAETAQIGTCEAETGPPTIVGTPASSFAALWPIEEGCSAGPVYHRLDGAIVTPSGNALSVSEDDPLPPIEIYPIETSSASFASNSTTTVGTWTEAEMGRAANVEVELLLPMDNDDRTHLADGTNGLVRPAIATDGADYLVIWSATPSSIRGARYRPGAGRLDGPTGFQIASNAQQLSLPRLAFGNGNYVAAWTVQAADGSYHLQTALISTSGSPAPVETVASGLLFRGDRDRVLE